MMYPRRLAALATICVAACASTETPDMSPDVDPSLPGVEGSGDPSRWDGGASQKLPESNPPPPEEEEETNPTPMPEGGTSTKTDGGTSGGGTADSGSGTTSGAPKPTQGEVLITEVMFDSAGAEPDGEWFELYNAASSARSLAGLTLVDGANRTHTIKSGTTIAAGAYVVFVRNRSVSTTAKVPGASSAYEYGAGITSSTGIQLANGTTGSLALKDGSTTIAESAYGGWFTTSGGASVQMKTLTYAAGSNKGAWCLSATSWSGATEKGTPGAASNCP
jgi:hypothetical protein